MSRVRISFTIAEYDGSLLDDSKFEAAPIVACWSSIAGRRKTFFPVKWREGTNRSKSHPIEAFAELDVVAGVNYNANARAVTIGIDDTLGIRVKAHTPNEQGVLSIQNCGDVLVPLGQMLGDALRVALNDVNRANRSLSEKELPLALQFYVYTDEDGSRVNKGAMLINNIRATLDDSKTPLALDLQRDAKSGEVVQPNEFSYIAANERLFAAAMQNIMARSILMFTEDAVAQGFGFLPSSDESKRVHAPFFAICSGMLPGFSYVMRPGDAAPSAATHPRQFAAVQTWLRKLGDYALARINQPPEWFIKTVATQLTRTDNTFDDSIVECANLLGQVLAIAPTALPYVSDEVRTGARGAQRLARVKTRNGYIDFVASHDKPGVHAVERFSEAGDNDGADCEDVAMLANRIASILAAGNWTDPLVESLASLMRQYVPVVNLGSVKDASVGNDLRDSSKLRDGDIIDSDIDRDQAYGAHMWCEAIPLVKFVALVQRSTPDLNPELLWLPGAVRAPWAAALPQLLVEGTGRLDSLQLPRIAYVMTDDASNTRKKALIAQQDVKHRLIEHLLANTRTFKCMQMVREQIDRTNTPNKRPTKFYRQTTHSFTSAFLQNGLSTVDFISAHRGQRVPTPSNADPLFAGNPIALAMRAPGAADAPAPPIAEQQQKVGADEWRERAAFHNATAWDATAQSDGLRVALQLVTAQSTTAPNSLIAGQERRQPEAFYYGVPLYDRLQAPLLAATCLVPGTPLNAREMRIIATLMRQAPPISMPGDWEQIEAMHAAALESRFAESAGTDDERTAMALEDSRFSELQQKIRVAMGTFDDATGTASKEWPKRGSHVDKWTLLTFFFPFATLRNEKNADAIVADIVAQKTTNVVRFARLLSEESMPYRRFATLQLLCDSK